MVSEVGLGRLRSWREGRPSLLSGTCSPVLSLSAFSWALWEESSGETQGYSCDRYPRWEGWSRQDLPLSPELGRGHPAVDHHAGLFHGQDVGSIQFAPYTSRLQRATPHVLI